MLATRDRTTVLPLGRPAPCLWGSFALTVAGVAALLVDVPTSGWLLTQGISHEFRRFIDLCEVFGHGFGVTLILISVWVLDPGSRRCMPRLVAMSLGAGLLANLGKLAVARTRPVSFDFSNQVLDSFGGWFPLLANDSRSQGCPSSHVATAVGLAIGLSWLYPRGRKLFYGLAMAVAAQRLVSGAHFVSDTLWGASVAAALCGMLKIRSAFNDRWIDWEHKSNSLNVRTPDAADHPVAA